MCVCIHIHIGVYVYLDMYFMGVCIYYIFQSDLDISVRLQMQWSLANNGGRCSPCPQKI